MTTVLMFSPEALAGYLDTALLTIVNLLVTYYVLNRFLFKPILKMLRKRRDEVSSELDQASQKLSDAQVKLDTAEQRLSQSSHEAVEIVSNARAQAEVQSEGIISEAKRDAATLLTRADNDIGRMRVTMVNSVRDEVAELSVAIASKVIGQAMDERRRRELVDHYLDQELSSRAMAAAPSGEEPTPETQAKTPAASQPATSQPVADAGQSGVT